MQPHLGPGVLAPDGLCCPVLLRLATPAASLTTSAPLPGNAGYRDSLWHSRALLPGRQTFRTFTAELSRIAALELHREARRVLTPVLPRQQRPSGRTWKPLALPTFRSNQLHAGFVFGGQSVRFRYGPSGCLPPCAGPTKVSPADGGFYFRASSLRVTPPAAGYDYDAALGLASAGLSPASSAASLAAQVPGESL